MKAPQTLTLAATSLLALQLTACEAVKFVFKTGFWVGALLVIGLILLVGFFVRRTG